MMKNKEFSQLIEMVKGEGRAKYPVAMSGHATSYLVFITRQALSTFLYQ